MGRTVDYLIVGAGIVGLALARELKSRNAKSRITVVEKEIGLGKHSSGRNSGVLHSGIFYSDDSVKAKVCAEGAKELADYCHQKKLPIRKTGKVIVPTSEDDVTRLNVLLERGKRNEIVVNAIDSVELAKIEPDVRSYDGTVLHLPEVSVIDPLSILQSLANDLISSGVEMLYNTPFRTCEPAARQATVAQETISYGHLFNSAGLQADLVAKSCGIGQDYVILPFKGIYYRLRGGSPLRIRGLIYAVPNPRVPFLGIHYSRNVHDEVFIGPTVVPALGRENYQGLAGMKPTETFRIVNELIRLYLANKQGFRTFARQEGLRFMKRFFYEKAKSIVPALKPEDLLPSDKVGIRAQLVNRVKGELVMDFLVVDAEHSTHILNAVSPAFTSSFAFARRVVDHLRVNR